MPEQEIKKLSGEPYVSIPCGSDGTSPWCADVRQQIRCRRNLMQPEEPCGEQPQRRLSRASGAESVSDVRIIPTKQCGPPVAIFIPFFPIGTEEQSGDVFAR